MSTSANKRSALNRIPALIVLVLSCAMTAGSQTFLAPCIHEDGAFGSCHWAGQALLGIGGVLLLLALAACFCRDGRVRRGLYGAILPVAALGILTPGTLISLCRMSAMRCRMVMQPAMIILCALMLLAALAGWLMERKRP
ncbi:MAG: DUF4418 family protein [Clostridia bacterium]|nr:DUF4418 family protein [Clostridia bacterium]